MIPCNSAYHWYEQLRARSAAPLLHIADACVAAVPMTAKRVAVFATRGTLASGFYQTALAARDIEAVVPDQTTQARIDACIRASKGGDLGEAAVQLSAALAMLIAQNVQIAVMGCTEVPLAARQLSAPSMTLIDSSLELARATVAFATERGWNVPQ